VETTAARAERLYTQIKAIAITAMQSERPGHTLQPTAVANEAFLRLADYRAGWNDDSEFMRAVVTTVRRVLVDHARTKGRKKRGGAHQRIELFDVAATESNVDLLQVDELLNELGKRDQLAAFAMEASVFGGLNDAHIAELMGTDTLGVQKHRRRGRAWLASQLESSD
tara:strand:- start:312 stop:815 length:504 start_codon:yes stop_codon:yes gene_type:complete